MRRTLLAALLLCWGPPGHADDLTVSAAASLTNAFREIAGAFEQAHPEHQVQLNFAGSGVLLQQIARGAPVDIFASADQLSMDQAEQQKLVDADSRRDFVSNELVLITPVSGSPVRNLKDLLGPEYQRIAVSNPDSVPVGRYSRDALAGLDLWQPLHDKLIRTQNVRQTLDYVARNEVDAGFVYATDAALMPDRVSVQLQVPAPTAIFYPVAVTATGANKPVSALFLDFLFSEPSQAVLTRYGFGPAN